MRVCVRDGSRKAETGPPPGSVHDSPARQIGRGTPDSKIRAAFSVENFAAILVLVFGACPSRGINAAEAVAVSYPRALRAGLTREAPVGGPMLERHGLKARTTKGAGFRWVPERSCC